MDEWTEVRGGRANGGSRLDQIEQRLETIEKTLRDVLAHVRQQSIIARPHPLMNSGDEVSAARAANLALRTREPFPLFKARSDA